MIALETSVDLGKFPTAMKNITTLLGSVGRRELHEKAALTIVDLLQTHIAKYANEHHGTADNIEGGPATRSKHLEFAVESVALGDITPDSGEVTISSPGFRRALGPLTIVPKTKPALTVAVHALSYNKTVADLIASGLNIFSIHSKKTGGDYLATTTKDSGSTELLVLYALKDSVTLKHAPEMLPTGEEFKKAGRDGVVAIIVARLEQAGAA